MELTPWYPPNIKPVRVGVYERQHKHAILYSMWDGHNWHCSQVGSYAAALPDIPVSYFQAIPWRGLAEEPK